MFQAKRFTRRALWLSVGLLACFTAPGCAGMQSYLSHRPAESPGGTSSGIPDLPYGANQAANESDRPVAQKTATGPKTWLVRASSDLRARTGRLSARLGITHPAPPAVASTADESKNKEQPKNEDATRPVRIALETPTALGPRGQAAPRRAPASATTPAGRPGTPAPTTQPPKDPAQIQAQNAAKAMAPLVAATQARLDSISNYQVKLTRQERIGTSLQEPEEVVLSVRRQPQAVRLEWREGPHKGREVLFTADRDGGVMQVNMADSIVPMPRLSMRPDSPMALAQSRHPITEAGFETIVARLTSTLKQTQSGDVAAGPLVYSGVETIAESAHPCHKFRQSKQGGETWLVYIDSQTKLPALVQATAGNGDVLERYVFRDVETDLTELGAADAFDADKRWGEPPSLFRRLARASASDPQADVTQPR
jgi:hypothetical protein